MASCRGRKNEAVDKILDYLSIKVTLLWSQGYYSNHRAGGLGISNKMNGIDQVQLIMQLEKSKKVDTRIGFLNAISPRYHSRSHPNEKKKKKEKEIKKVEIEIIEYPIFDRGTRFLITYN